MAKRRKTAKKEEEADDVKGLQSKEDAPKRKAKSKLPKKVNGKKVADEEEDEKPVRKTDERPLSVGGIIIRTQREQAAWEKEAPWHRKNPAESRFRDHGTTRRPKD
jgi:hypothetical protein